MAQNGFFNLQMTARAITDIRRLPRLDQPANGSPFLLYLIPSSVELMNTLRSTVARPCEIIVVDYQEDHPIPQNAIEEDGIRIRIPRSVRSAFSQITPVLKVCGVCFVLWKSTMALKNGFTVRHIHSLPEKITVALEPISIAPQQSVQINLINETEENSSGFMRKAEETAAEIGTKAFLKKLLPMVGGEVKKALRNIHI